MLRVLFNCSNWLAWKVLKEPRADYQQLCIYIFMLTSTCAFFVCLPDPACSMQLWPRGFPARGRVRGPHGPHAGDGRGPVPLQGERGGRSLRQVQGKLLRAEPQRPPGLPAYVNHLF